VDPTKDPLKTTIGQTSAPSNGTNAAIPQGNNTIAAPTSYPNPTNSLRFMPNNSPTPGENNNFATGTQMNPVPAATPQTTLFIANPAAGSTQPIATNFPTGDPAASRQTLWTETKSPGMLPGSVVPVSATSPFLNQSEAVPQEQNAGDGDIPVYAGGITNNYVDVRQSVGDVLQHALAHHPALRVRKYEVEAARARLISARLLPNPEFMLQTSSPTNSDDSSDLATRLMFTIPIGPKRAWRTAAAQSDIYKTQKALSVETKLILTEAAEAAVEVLYLQEQEQLYKQLKQFSDQAAALQQEQFKIAAVTYRDAVLAELTAFKMEMDRRNTEASLNQAKVRLARAMGLPDASPPLLQGRLTVETIAFCPLQSVLNRASQTSPELAQACGAIQENKQLHTLERWNALPDISIGPRVINDLSGPPNDRVGGRIQVDVPIFDRNQGNIAETAADVRISCAEYDLARVTTLGDVASLYQELQDVQSRAEYYQARIQPLIDQTQQSLQSAFESRQVTAAEFTKLVETLSRMKLIDLELRYAHHRLRTRLELLLECPISSLGGSEIPPMPPTSVPLPLPQEMPVESANP
jgi:cobalt-zinc-cadmium efflux system outer membrane protein